MTITWFAVILTSRFINLNDGHNGYKRWFACFEAKKVKDRSLWSSESFNKRLCFFVLFSSGKCCVEPPYRRVEVDNHPSHEATLTADLRVAKTWDIAVFYLFLFLILPVKVFTDFRKILFLKNLLFLEGFDWKDDR